MPAAKVLDEQQYSIAMLPPPGSIVAPDGFPANPYPKHAPQIFKDAMKVRIEVFCEEQKCSVEPELDEDDPRSWHWVLYKNQDEMSSSGNKTPLSVIRIVPPPHAPHPNGFEDPNESPYCKLGRVATIKHARGQGLSKHLIEAAFQWMSNHKEDIGHDWDGLVLTHAQVEVEKVYQKVGFVTDDNLGRWDEEGIEHLGMWRQLKLNE